MIYKLHHILLDLKHLKNNAKVTLLVLMYIADVEGNFLFSLSILFNSNTGAALQVKLWVQVTMSAHFALWVTYAFNCL